MPQCSAVAAGRKTSNSICVSVFGLPCDRFWKIAAGGRGGQGKNEVGIVGNRCRKKASINSEGGSGRAAPELSLGGKRSHSPS